MQPADRQTRFRRGTSRRLSSHVLRPLAVVGVIAVAGSSAAVTISARDAAERAVDQRAATFRALAAPSLRHGGKLGSVAGLARSQGVRLRVTRADRPLPAGRSVRTVGDRRVYAYPVRGGRRLHVGVPASSIAEATTRALLLSLAAGALILLLVLGLARRLLRVAAGKPLERLAGAVDRMAAGDPARVDDVRGASEVHAVASRLDAVAAAMAELTSQATTDPLTGVSNRRAFYSSLDAELKRAQRTGTPATLVLIDLDGFKEINDTHGHPFGDGVLQTIAEKVRGTLRATDVIARVGGDEFAVLLPATAREAAGAMVDRARQEATASIGGVELTWSAGVATYPSDARDVPTLVECADAALYCAKASGYSTVCNYDPETQQVPHTGGDLSAVESVLAKRDGVVPVFQPIVSLATGQIAGYEALARFPHPPARRPDEWFSMAQRVGLGAKLEARAVSAALAVPGRPAGTFLSFNLSASVLMSDEATASLPADLSGVVIEITENERVGSDERLAERLEPLRRRGARVAVDDAGAGYSGLQQVMRIQPDIIKLDRSLVANVDTDPAKAALIDSFVRFARRTGAAVCAEGIESPEELKVLADLDVTYGQGFGLARPAAPWTSIATWVPGTIRPRALRAASDADPEENEELRLATLTSRLANARSAEELPALAPLIAAELGADEVAFLRVAADAVVAVNDQPWLPMGTALKLANYPTLRQILTTQQAVQILDGDPSADVGELSLLGRSGHHSMLLAPVVAHGDVTGILLALTPTERPWTRAETSRARIVGHQVGSLIEDSAAGVLVSLPQPDEPQAIVQG